MSELQESEDEIRIRKIIADNGFHIACFDETDYLPGFGYTIGLWQNFSHPEILCIGLPGETIWEILKVVTREVSRGTKFETEVQYNGFSKTSPIQFIQTTNQTSKILWATAYGLMNINHLMYCN